MSFVAELLHLEATGHRERADAAPDAQIMRLIHNTGEIFPNRLLTLTGNESQRVYASFPPSPPPSMYAEPGSGMCNWRYWPVWLDRLFLYNRTSGSQSGQRSWQIQAGWGRMAGCRAVPPTNPSPAGSAPFGKGEQVEHEVRIRDSRHHCEDHDNLSSRRTNA